jgi:hypothetical protein
MARLRITWRRISTIEHDRRSGVIQELLLESVPTADLDAVGLLRMRRDWEATAERTERMK